MSKTKMVKPAPAPSPRDTKKAAGSVTPAAPAKGKPKVAVNRVRPGIIFNDNNSGNGLSLILNVVGEYVHMVNPQNNTLWTMSRADVADMLEEQDEKGSVADVFADNIAAMFELHPATRPFTPAKKYRDLPIVPTPAGKDFLKQLLKVCNLNPDDDWKVFDIFEELGSLRQDYYENGKARKSLFEFLKGRGIEAKFDWDCIIDAIKNECEAPPKVPSPASELAQTTAPSDGQKFNVGDWICDKDQGKEGQVVHITRDGWITMELMSGGSISNPPSEFEFITEAPRLPISAAEPHKPVR